MSISLSDESVNTQTQNRVEVTHAVKERLEDAFQFEARGVVDIKGKGPTPTWFLTGRASATSAPHQPARETARPTIGG